MWSLPTWSHLHTWSRIHNTSFSSKRTNISNSPSVLDYARSEKLSSAKHYNFLGQLYNEENKMLRVRHLYSKGRRLALPVNILALGGSE